MTIRNIPDSPPSVLDANIRSGNPVRSHDQWLSLSGVANYLNGNEISLVAAHPITDVIDDSNSTLVCNYKFLTRQQVRTVLWVIVLRAFDFEAPRLNCRGTVRVGTGTTYSFGLSGADELGDPYVMYILETRSQTSTAYNQYVTITKVAGDADVRVDQIAAYQLRRYGLDPEAGTSEHASDLPSCNPNAIILDSTGYSVDGVIDGITTAKENCRRASMFAWHAPLASGIRIGQGSSWNNMFHQPPEVLMRYVTSGVSSTAIRIDVLSASGNDTSTYSYIRFVSDSGDSATIVLSNPVGATWDTTYVNVYTENPDSSNGRREAASADRITVSIYGNGNTVATDGLFAIRIYSICIGES